VRNHLCPQRVQRPPKFGAVDAIVRLVLVDRSFFGGEQRAAGERNAESAGSEESSRRSAVSGRMEEQAPEEA
jgi:hypothetical protein